MIGRRNRFRDVIVRQLDLFAHDQAALLEDCEAALVAYRQAEREDAEARYGEYVDAVDAAREELERLRDAYAETLDGPVAQEYASAFATLARKRFPDVASELW